MKKTRKVLSVVLSLLVVLASMPVMYTATAAAGTVDNPTTALEESNPYEYDDLFKLNIKHSNNNFFFYQTIDDEYFVLKQSMNLQQTQVSLGSNRTLTFHGINFYEGGSNIADATDLAGVVEEPTIVNNPTSDFRSKYYSSDSWVSTHANSSGLDCTGDVDIQASGWDLNGNHKNYSWDHNVVFKGHPAGATGQINTGYYERLTWDWVGDKDTYAAMDFRIKTTITVVDARAFVNELAEKEAIVANPQGYSAAYVSAIKSALADIPADLKDLSARYTQSIVNHFTESLTSIPENCADYTEFNRVLAESRAFANDGTYSVRSYNAYVEQIESINAALPKNLDAAQQAYVDAAVQALIDAKELLVIEFPSSGSTATSTIEDLTPVVENEFNFIQTEDDQVFAFTQGWTMTRGNNSSNRMFYITLDTTDSNTASFLPRLTTDCVATVPSITSGAFEGALSNQTIFTNWHEVDANGNPKADVEAITDGLIDPSYAGFQNGVTYYFDNPLSFVGLSASESGSRTFTYNQKLYINWTQWVIVTINHYNTATYTTTLNITDARPLVDAYNDALATLENPGEYSERYIETLEGIVNSVPQDMVNGTKYYTQAEVDKLHEALTTLNDRDADYTGLEEAYQRVEEILANPDAYSGATLAAAQAAKAAADALERNLIDSAANREFIAGVIAGLNSAADNATARADYSLYNSYLDICYQQNPAQFPGDSYAEFMEVVKSVDSALAKDLSVNEQSVVNKACQDLLDAYNKLYSGAPTNPDSIGGAFTQDAITGEYTNGVIKFSLNSGEYFFTQTANDEKLAIKTDFTVSSANANYVVTLDSLKISSLDKSEFSMDTTGTCFNEDGAVVNDAETLFCKENVDADVISGVTMYAADSNGDMAHFTTWENTAGVALSAGGVLNPSTTLTTEASSASAQYTYTSVGGGDTTTKTRAFTYVLRLGWSETDVATNTTVSYHAHIPVTLTISDARSLRSTYYSYKAFIDAGNDGTYLDSSFEAAKELVYSVNTDIVNGKGYYTQEQIDAESAKLASASAALQEKADYSGFDEAYKNAQDIINAAAGTYTDKTLDEVKNALAAADALGKDLPASEQATINKVIEDLVGAVTNIQEKADYSGFESVKDALEEIVNAPEGTYPDSTVEAAKDALEKAENLDKDLPATEQDEVNRVTSELQEVVNSAEKKADYTDYNNAKAEADSIVNDDGNGNPIYDEDAFNAYKDAVNKIDTALDKDLPESEQSKVNDAANALADAKTELENNKKADYTDFNTVKDALEEIVNAPAGTYTEETVKNAQEALDNANQIPDNLVVGENNVNQDMIDNATQNMQAVINSAEKKADYTEFDKVVEDLENIVNAPEGTYTDETVKNAQDALDSIVDVDKDMADTEQGILDEITSGLKDVVDSAEKKADYTEFDKAVEDLENIVNAPEGTYTDETVKNAQDALDSVAGVDKDLPQSAQGTLDEITSGLKDVVDSAENKADYTDYNNTKSEADSLVNDDGNGNPIYDEDAFNAYKDAVNKIDNELDKDLPASEQGKVDDAANALDNALNTLEASKYYTVTFLDAEGNLLSAERFVSGAVFGTIVAPALPESTDEIAVVGWAYENDTIAGAEDVLTSDVTVKVAAEDKVLRIFNESGLSFDAETGYIVTELRSLTVADVLAKFDNDATLLTVADFEGNVLSADDYVGSGAVITLSSKYTNTVYESRTFVIYGDVTGDGLVNADDYAVARRANIIPGSYNESNHYFFVANDVAKDGYIDALDTAYINLMVKGYK